jgi:hypothetical protein
VVHPDRRAGLDQPIDLGRAPARVELDGLRVVLPLLDLFSVPLLALLGVLVVLPDERIDLARDLWVALLEGLVDVLPADDSGPRCFRSSMRVARDEILRLFRQSSLTRRIPHVSLSTARA